MGLGDVISLRETRNVRIAAREDGGAVHVVDGA